MTDKNLWGELPEINKVRTPLAILKEQGNTLKELTKGMLEGHANIYHQKVEDFRVKFSLISPPLGGYRLELFDIRYGLGMYPVNVYPTFEEIPDTECNNEEEFEAILQNIFQAKFTRTAISRILVQVKSSE
jgi:hypothetical protein